MRKRVLKLAEAALIAGMVGYLCYRYFSCDVSLWEAWSPARELYLWGYFVPWIAVLRLVRQLLELSERNKTDYVFFIIKIILWVCMGIYAIVNSYMYPFENGSYYPGGSYPLFLIPIGLLYFVHWIVRCIWDYRVPILAEMKSIWKSSGGSILQKLFATGRNVVWYVLYGYACCALLHEMLLLCPLAAAFEFVSFTVIPIACVEIIMLLVIPDYTE